MVRKYFSNLLDLILSTLAQQCDLRYHQSVSYGGTEQILVPSTKDNMTKGHQPIVKSRYGPSKWSSDTWPRLCGRRNPRVCKAKRTVMQKALSICWWFHNITSPFYKVHCDLWGPGPIRSKEQFRFYVVFIEDYNRFTWFYPMRHKSDLFEWFVHFL